jgi:release factor glutamine methyltransferase
LPQNEKRIWTIRQALGWISNDFASREIPSPRLDAELLISRALGLDRIGLYTDLERPLQRSELARIHEMVVRRRRYEPVAYILGEKEFFGRVFEVTPDVLIPRPDTELVVERALRVCPQHSAGRVLDLGTGSGAIAVTIASERANLLVDATDISQAALVVAARNARKHEVDDRVRIYHRDLFEAPSGENRFSDSENGLKSALYDLVVSNPPYIADDQWEDLALDIREHEPKIALQAGKDGLDFYRRICTSALEWIALGGFLILEVGQGQASAVVEMAASTRRFSNINVYRDFSGIERVVQAEKAA